MPRSICWCSPSSYAIGTAGYRPHSHEVRSPLFFASFFSRERGIHFALVAPRYCACRLNGSRLPANVIPAVAEVSASFPQSSVGTHTRPATLLIAASLQVQVPYAFPRRTVGTSSCYILRLREGSGYPALAKRKKDSSGLRGQAFVFTTRPELQAPACSLGNPMDTPIEIRR